MKKILIVATVVKTHVNTFHLPTLKMLKEKGYEVHVASHNDFEKPNELYIPFCDKFIEIPFERSPLKINNIKAYLKLKKLIRKEEYDIIYCHTPVGAALARLAARKSRVDGTRVVYTAHGFHFYKGAPLINWLIYYPVEKWLSRFTDSVITINLEDYERAKSFKAENVHYIPGVGINLDKYSVGTIDERNNLRDEYNISKDDFILFYAGELSDDKNQEMLLEAMKKLQNLAPSIKLYLAGRGKNRTSYLNYIEENELKNVKLLGYRDDIDKLMRISNVGVSTSKREGLPVNVMEAMATGLPLIATNCRGNRDLVVNGENGYLVEIDDVDNLIEKILNLYSDKDLRKKFSENSRQLIDKYSIDRVLDMLSKIF